MRLPMMDVVEVLARKVELDESLLLLMIFSMAVGVDLLVSESEAFSRSIVRWSLNGHSAEYRYRETPDVRPDNF